MDKELFVGMDISHIRWGLSIVTRLRLNIQLVSESVICSYDGFESGQGMLVGMNLSLIPSRLFIAICLLLIIKSVSAALAR